MASNPLDIQPDRIDIQDEAAIARWAKKLDTTSMQIADAVAEVGDKAADVEMHLKGSHSTTNADRVKEVVAATTGLDGSKSVL